MRTLVVFNKEGTKYGTTDVPPLIYLETQRDWIRKALMTSNTLDGIAILIDWETRELSCQRNLAS